MASTRPPTIHDMQTQQGAQFVMQSDAQGDAATSVGGRTHGKPPPPAAGTVEHGEQQLIVQGYRPGADMNTGQLRSFGFLLTDIAIHFQRYGEYPMHAESQRVAMGAAVLEVQPRQAGRAEMIGRSLPDAAGHRFLARQSTRAKILFRQVVITAHRIPLDLAALIIRRCPQRVSVLAPEQRA